METKRIRLDASMESLPDELLLEVLSYLDPVTLLGPVRCVCRKWHSVVGWDALWRRVDLLCDEPAFGPPEWPSSVSVKSLIHLLARVPALRSVRLRLPAVGQAKVDAIDALKHGVGDVQMLDVRKFHMSNEDLVQLMIKYSPTLRVLRFDPIMFDDSEALGILHAMAFMKRLRCLDMNTYDFNIDGYDGFLAIAGPELEYLYWNASPDVHEQMENNEDIAFTCPVLQDLIWKSRHHLVSLKVWNPKDTCKLSQPLINAISQCHKLREVLLPGMNFHLIQNMPLLRKVHLTVWQVPEPADIRRVRDQIVESIVLPKVRFLGLYFRYRDLTTTGDVIGMLVPPLAKACTAMRELELAGSVWNGIGIPNYVAMMSQVEKLNIGYCSCVDGGFINTIVSRLSNLKYIDIRTEDCTPLMGPGQTSALGAVLRYIHLGHPKVLHNQTLFPDV